MQEGKNFISRKREKNEFQLLQIMCYLIRCQTMITAVYESNSCLVRKGLWDHLKNLRVRLALLFVDWGRFNVIAELMNPWDITRRHDTSKIVDSIQDRGINQVYIIGGDGTQRGAALIFEEIRRRGLKVSVAGIPKTIDNDIPVIDSLWLRHCCEEAQYAINAAHVEAESFENCIGLVKVMGRYSGSYHLCCPKIYVIHIQDYFSKQRKMPINLKYSNASDNVYCTLLAQSAVHGAMAGYTGFTSGLVDGRHTYIPFNVSSS
ncbi:ATP-dependent 6-phosphofructokinase 6 [Hibiscus syriacus]|uniref:ATP-dependent 6-phosphofructokinase 6 n=1 Tax=Hibiscus syriacus TaxID=106335 RepID=A0A6A3B573_HIBSY|nr:ATP-dependent 6-phosphofructokinase 6 [Hibiscus syriacus]